jgi:5-methylcytosine-specific restriction endonuclease McrA
MDTCPICSTPFKRKYAKKGQRQIYCSRRCGLIASTETVHCLTCGSPFTRNRLMRSRNKQYCSVNCIERKPCEVCGTMILGRGKYAGYNRRFCSRKCSALATRTMTAQGYQIRGFAATIIRIGKLQCERCGNGNVIHLVVHHRDRDHANIRLSNLETLCANCHLEEHHSDGKKRVDLLPQATFLAAHTTESATVSAGSPRHHNP